MDLDAVPQEGNATLGGHRKAMYARDAQGRLVIAPSAGWEAEEIVTLHAAASLQSSADDALARARAGQCSPLEYWMYQRRMDLPLLAQTTGLWAWRVKRHFDAHRFARLSDALLRRYADALGLPVATLRTLP